MTFKIVPVDEVVLYLRRSLGKTKSIDRQNAIKELLNRIDESEYKVLHAFQNEYGENYLVIKDQKKRWHWCGDESDWEFAKSYYEDQFVRELWLKDEGKKTK